MTDFKDKKIQSDFLWVLKAIAVISIVSAHVSGIGSFVTNNFAISLSIFMQSFGAVGVGVFFLVSGYLYPFSRQKCKSFTSFFKKKANMLIPWFFCAILVYLYVAVRNGFSFKDLITGIFGYYTSFWYMSVLWIFLLIFFCFYKVKWFLSISIIISICSSVIIGMGILPKTVFHVYLNPFSWAIWFVLGIIINTIGIDKILSVVSKAKVLLIILNIAVFAVMSYFKIKHSYFSAFYIPLEILAILGFMAVSLCIIESKLNNKFVDFGKNSFSVYLLHEFGFAGFTAYLLNRFGMWWTTPIRPILVCVTVYLCIKFGRVISQKLHFEKLYNTLIGGR